MGRPKVSVYRFHPEHGHEELLYEGPFTDGLGTICEGPNGGQYRVSVEELLHPVTADHDPQEEADDGG